MLAMVYFVLCVLKIKRGQNYYWKTFGKIKIEKKLEIKKRRKRETPALGLMAQSAEAQSLPPPRCERPSAPRPVLSLRPEAHPARATGPSRVPLLWLSHGTCKSASPSNLSFLLSAWPSRTLGGSIPRSLAYLLSSRLYKALAPTPPRVLLPFSPQKLCPRTCCCSTRISPSWNQAADAASLPLCSSAVANHSSEFAVSFSPSRCFSFKIWCSETSGQRAPASSAPPAMAPPRRRPESRPARRLVVIWSVLDRRMEIGWPPKEDTPSAAKLHKEPRRFFPFWTRSPWRFSQNALSSF